jgi:hypothetical protein
MTRGRLVTAIASGLAVGGLVLGLTLSASATPAHPVASTAAPFVTSAPPVVFDCPAQSALVEPKTYILTCADANSYVGKLSWTSWTSGLASAKGVLAENDCLPYCAAGHFRSYPAVVVFWGDAAVQNHPGERRYTMMTVILTGPRPRYYDYLTHKWVTAPVTQTSTLPAGSGTPTRVPVTTS